MSMESAGHPPNWWSAPGEGDPYAWLALGVVGLFILLIFYLYALFDRFTEHRSRSTPLKTTVPTLLVIALAYEVLPPLGHFSFLLPLALIATALARDLMLWFDPDHPDARAERARTDPPAAADEEDTGRA
jgi:sorbitol-specific phosphotransferase system component IIC